MSNRPAPLPLPQPPERRARRGMTIVEVIVALVLLATVLLALGSFGVRLAQSTTSARALAVADRLATDRLEAVKDAPRYAAIDSLYATTEGTVAGYPGYHRRTIVNHVGGGSADSTDYRVVTVEVTSRRLASPVRKSTVIAQF